jgi:hypothetical protein
MARLRQLFPALLLLSVLTALASPRPALAFGGSYVVDGGTPPERAQVRAALDVSAFDWGAVPATVRIHVRRNVQSRSAPGEIWLDANLLDAGRYSWGFVQHEYAHQVDFSLLDDSQRAVLLDRLGGRTWWWDQPGLAHAEHGCERFASALAWAYWPSKDNALRPTSRRDESAAMQPAAFRRLLGQLLGGSATYHRWHVRGSGDAHRAEPLSRPRDARPKLSVWRRQAAAPGLSTTRRSIEPSSRTFRS